MFQKPFFVIAHRGASKVTPENTMSAFRKAYDFGADMIETDVQLTKDRVPVLFHDEKLHKHTNGRGILSNFTFQELKKLDAGSWFSVDYQHEQIPKLEDLLLWAKDKILLNIEIKPEAVTENVNGGVEELVIQLICELGMESNVLLSSFDYRAVRRCKQIHPEIKTGLLYNPQQYGRENPCTLVRENKADAFHCSSRELKLKWAQELNENQIPFFIYTVNRKNKMEKWIEKGAKGLFSDDPELLKIVANEFLKR